MTALFCSSMIRAELWADGANISFIANMAELIVPPGRFLAFLLRLIVGIPTARAIKSIEPKITSSSMAT